MTETNSNKGVKRPTRTPLYKQKVLTATHKEGFVRRYVNEDTGRIEAFMEAGWKPVVGDENTSDERAQSESQLGSVNRKVVNKDPRASTQTAILMEIPEEWYREDQVEKQKEVDVIEASYDPSKFQQGTADYGEMKKEYK